MSTVSVRLLCTPDVGPACDDEPVRSEPSILHVDLDAFFAAVEQRDKPSLRGKPVVVGGLGPRGVVATASYEARAFGVHSAMPTREARSRCPHAAFLYPRFAAYARASKLVMEELRRLSPILEPLSLDEAFVDLAAGAPRAGFSAERVREIGARLKAAIRNATALTASVGAGSSKFVAKLSSDLDKPDGLRVVEPGTELDLLRPLPVTKLWGVGPATAARLNRAGLNLIGELERVSQDELTRIVGQSLGAHLYRLARAEDDRPVVAERESKSVSVEDTFDHDIAEPARLASILAILTSRVVRRLVREGLSGRTVTIKVRLHDFTTLSRSYTLPGPTDSERTIGRVARRLLGEVDVSSGVRLLGVGISALTDWVQGDLFEALPDDSGVGDAPGSSHATTDLPPAPNQAVAGESWAAVPATSPGATSAGPQALRVAADAPAADQEAAGAPFRRSNHEAPTGSSPLSTGEWLPGRDVFHDLHGQGWVWGSKRGLVTIRFETRDSGPGPIRTVPSDDPALHPANEPEAH